MICEKCKKGNMIKRDNMYVCENCGAVAVEEEKDNIKAVTDIIEGGNPDEKNEEPKKKSFLRETLDFCLPIVIALVVAILLKTFVFANSVVPTGSMLNTIQKDDRIIASRLAYKFDDPERYDIIIFKIQEQLTDVYVE